MCSTHRSSNNPQPKRVCLQCTWLSKSPRNPCPHCPCSFCSHEIRPPPNTPISIHHRASRRVSTTLLFFYIYNQYLAARSSWTQLHVTFHSFIHIGCMISVNFWLFLYEKKKSRPKKKLQFLSKYFGKELKEIVVLNKYCISFLLKWKYNIVIQKLQSWRTK